MNPVAVVRNARELAAQVFGKLGEYAEDEHSDWVEEAAETFVGDFSLTEDDMLLLTPWLLFQHQRGGKTIAQRYVEEHGAELTEAERAFIEAQREAGFSWWHITESEGGMITVRDLFTGEQRKVCEPELAEVDQTGMVAFASVLEWRGVSMFTAMDANALPFDAVNVLVSAVGEEVSLTPGSTSRDRLREQAVQQSLVSRWRQVVEAMEGIYEGEEGEGGGLIVTDHYTFAPEKRDEVIAALSKVENVKFDEPEQELQSALIHLPEDEEQALGELTVGTDWLDVDSSSEWIEELKEMVQAACGDLITFSTREEGSLDDLLAQAGDFDEGADGGFDEGDEDEGTEGDPTSDGEEPEGGGKQ